MPKRCQYKYILVENKKYLGKIKAIRSAREKVDATNKDGMKYEIHDPEIDRGSSNSKEDFIKFFWATLVGMSLPKTAEEIEDLKPTISSLNSFDEIGCSNETKLTGEGCFQCSHCSFSTKFEYEFLQHMKLIYNQLGYITLPGSNEIGETLQDTIFECAYCSRSFASKLKIHNHLKRIHRGNYPYRCPCCSYNTDSQISLENHLEDLHMDKMHFECSPCRFKTVQQLTLKMHLIKYHMKGNYFECHCGLKFLTKCLLIAHINEVHWIKEPYYCLNCYFTTTVWEELISHTYVEHKCITYQYCDFKSKDKVTLDKHNNKTYGFECAKCEFKTTCKKILKEHEVTIHEKSRQYRCYQCSFTTMRSSCLKNHNWKVHHTKKCFYCSCCKYKTSQLATLKRHLKKNHCHLPLCKCSLSPSVHFKSNKIYYNTIQHLRCHICNFKTCQRNFLFTHLQTSQVEINPFQCPHCLFRAARFYLIKEHIQSRHTRQFLCFYCLLKFITKVQLEHHIKSVHAKLQISLVPSEKPKLIFM